MKYRKKPVVIEAMQFNGDNWIDCWKFMIGNAYPFPEIIKKRETIKIHTLEGTMTTSVGDYIIKGVHGEFYPCKPDIFEETYELIE